MTTESVELSLELFESLKGDPLEVVVGSPARTVVLRLEGVRRLPSLGSPRAQPFALDLCGSPEEPLPQGAFLFHHEKFGSQVIFIVPVAQDRSVRRYEAIFN